MLLPEECGTTKQHDDEDILQHYDAPDLLPEMEIS